MAMTPYKPLIVQINDWGEQNKPMVASLERQTVTLQLPGRSTPALDLLAERAGMRTDAFHMGYYGYLSICNANHVVLRGVGLLPALAHVDWRVLYNKRVPPHEAVAAHYDALK